MSNHYSEHFARIEKSCGSLLCELQKIRGEVGEADDEWDTTLFEVEQECLQVYMKRIEEAKECRTKLQRDITTAMAELSYIFTSMGEKSYELKPGGNMMEELETLIPLLEDMRRKKVERINQFVGAVEQIQKLLNEILGVKEQNGNKVFVDETNLSLRRLEELHSELRELQNEKINRLNQVQGHLYTISSLCTVLGMDFKQTVCRIHPGLDDLNVVKDASAIDPLYLLEQIDLQIAKVKEETVSRKEILEKVEKWWAAREEESWLEEYNRDDNRYNAGRGAHLILKRAEKARTAVNKIPAMVEALTSKTTAWEKEKGAEFFYDGGRLLTMLEDYSSLRQEKEMQKQRHRNQKKLPGQLMTEQEALYGSKPSPSMTGKKASRTPTTVASHRKLSFGGAILQQVKTEKPVSHLHPNKKADYMNENSVTNHQRSTGCTTHSGRRNSKVPGRVVKKHPLSAAKMRVIEPPAVRKPLSSVCFAVNNNANGVNPIEDQKKVEKEQIFSPGCKAPMAKASKTTLNEDEKGTPKTMPIPMPKTPSTVSAPMLMAITPATPATLAACKFEKILEQVQHIENSSVLKLQKNKR
ncbi:65-kDa microtubule-associated protein 4 [Hibiscus syriacus]|uniref:65-kDa microtubule-associated protein 4 n=1 Tax=Hibiscus syriacus TaxID=106335 RepID=A0A6A2X7B2_HIBSY|nr:65-kDa microtubule-associated protein 4 [Hibiscus syriacus]